MDQLRIYMIYFFSLKSLYFSQYNRKWDAVSTSLLWQSEHSLASLGSLFCLWRPVSMARLCPLSLSVFSLVFYQSRWSGTLPPCTLSLGSNTILIYFVIRWFGSNIWYHLLVVLRWLSWARLFVWCLSWSPGVWGQSFRTSWQRGLLSLFNSWHWRALYW